MIKTTFPNMLISRRFQGLVKRGAAAATIVAVLGSASILIAGNKITRQEPIKPKIVTLNNNPSNDNLTIQNSLVPYALSVQRGQQEASNAKEDETLDLLFGVVGYTGAARDNNKKVTDNSGFAKLPSKNNSEKIKIVLGNKTKYVRSKITTLENSTERLQAITSTNHLSSRNKQVQANVSDNQALPVKIQINSASLFKPNNEAKKHKAIIVSSIPKIDNNTRLDLVARPVASGVFAGNSSKTSLSESSDNSSLSSHFTNIENTANNSNVGTKSKVGGIISAAKTNDNQRLFANLKTFPSAKLFNRPQSWVGNFASKNGTNFDGISQYRDKKYLDAFSEDDSKTSRKYDNDIAPMPKLRWWVVRGGKFQNNVSTKEFDCLARAVYYEARGESPAGQIAVAKVIMNRVEHPKFPSTVCDVVYQNSHKKNRCQFSFACDGRSDRPRDKNAFKEALEHSAMVVQNRAPKPLVDGATHYHADYVKPRWASHYDIVGRIGTHIFYTMDRRRKVVLPSNKLARVQASNQQYSSRINRLASSRSTSVESSNSSNL